MPDLDVIRGDIEHMRIQAGRQRRAILGLQRAGLGTASAEALLSRMQARIDDLCAQRDALKKAQPHHNQGKALGGRTW